MTPGLNRPRPGTIVWDFGGVLFRWDPAALIARTLPHRISAEHSAQHWKHEFFARPDGEWVAYDRGTLGLEAVVTGISQRLAWPEAEVRSVVDAVPGELQPIEGSVRLLQALQQRGHRVHFLSNMPAPLADHLQRQHAFLALFAGGIFSSHVHLVKPEATIYALAEQRCGLDPAATLFIDDHPENIEAARRRGWQASLFTGPEALAGELRGLGLMD